MSDTMQNELIELSVDKELYIKQITEDKVINITGESGSGKSFYVQKYYSNDEYIVIDTDEVFSRFQTSTGINRELGEMFREKYVILPNICEDFDTIYSEILEYFKNSNKIIVIDSAQFRNLKNLKILKGKIIILRTSVNTCYQRCLERFKNKYPEATNEEFENYAIKKKQIYRWYKKLNEFILSVAELKNLK